ncbi:sulfite exporter TauE/SafE family protein [Romboutsia lituseburensis]|uniref:sulfite exporter TauE/SafE family protein n=1 Tax=Romboutsia lituseburensis TaxID=1537 RepID=UPI00215B0CD3|nr:sulfite exporter TauE/SafE family protein [Romboutsia lituseburensis]MCR8744040.1 sulfite exporter TauE/SafE family protein [Romboutsia lituseburensis]
MSIVYFLVGLVSTTVGAISGLGGGVIIKPVLDTLGNYSLPTIGVLSSFTVFSMSIVSLGKSLKNKVKLEGKKTICLATGSILGGFIGKYFFFIYLKVINNNIIAQKLQSIILFLLMFIVLLLYINEKKINAYKIKTKERKNNVYNLNDDRNNEYGYDLQNNIKKLMKFFIYGIVLGSISSFLGIGGGPLNVVVLMYLLDMDVKKSAIHSIFIIFFSQGSKLLSILLGEGFGVYNLEVLIYMILGGVSGGFLGSYFSNKIDKNKVKNIFIFCMVIIIAFNFYNIVK